MTNLYAALSSFQSQLRLPQKKKGTKRKEKNTKIDPFLHCNGAIDENPKGERKKYVGMKIFIYRYIGYNKYIFFNIICLAPSCLPFWTQWRKKERERGVVYYIVVGVLSISWFNVSSMNGRERGWIYKGKMNRYLFGRKGIRVIAWWWWYGRRGGGREKDQHVDVVINNIHCCCCKTEHETKIVGSHKGWGFSLGWVGTCLVGVCLGGLKYLKWKKWLVGEGSICRHWAFWVLGRPVKGHFQLSLCSSFW